jgi:hypothetical protein
MAYREVTMLEITEVLRQWLGGALTVASTISHCSSH